MPKKPRHTNILIPDLSEQEKSSFIQLLSNKYNTDNFNILYSIFGEELLLFLSVFAGKTIKVPSILLLQRIKEYSKIYSYLLKHKFSHESIKQAQLKFNIHPDKLDKITNLFK